MADKDQNGLQPQAEAAPRRSKSVVETIGDTVKDGAHTVTKTMKDGAHSVTQLFDKLTPKTKAVKPEEKLVKLHKTFGLAESEQLLQEYPCSIRGHPLHIPMNIPGKLCLFTNHLGFKQDKPWIRQRTVVILKYTDVKAIHKSKFLSTYDSAITIDRVDKHEIILTDFPALEAVFNELNTVLSAAKIEAALPNVKEEAAVLIEVPEEEDAVLIEEPKVAPEPEPVFPESVGAAGADCEATKETSTEAVAICEPAPEEGSAKGGTALESDATVAVQPQVVTHVGA